MSEVLLRRIADVDVNLDDISFTKEFPSLNARDFMTKIFGTKGMTTVVPDEYKRAITEFSTNASGKTASKLPPRYLLDGPVELGGYALTENGDVTYDKGVGSVEVDYKRSTLPPLILLHSAMILRPYPWITNTTLKSTMTAVSDEGDTRVFGSGASTQAENLYTYQYNNMAFKGDSGKFFERCAGYGSRTEIGKPAQTPAVKYAAISDDVKTAWNTLAKGSLLTSGVIEALKTYDETVYAGMTKDIRLSLESIFKLSKNQPFFIRTRMHKMSEAQIGYAKSTIFSKNDWATFYSDQKALSTATEIEWGGSETDGTKDSFKLIVRADGHSSVELYKKDEKSEWKIVGAAECLPSQPQAEASESNYKEITIYPLGRDLIVCAGVPSTQGTIERRYLRWSFNRFVNIDESTLKVYFYGGETYFTFQPIVHVQEGSLISPPVSCAFNVTASNAEEEGRFFLKVDYEGKFTLDHYGDTSSTEEISLPLPTQEDEGIPGGDASVSMQKGGKQAKRGKSGPFFGYLDGKCSLSKQIHRNVGGGQSDNESISVFYDKSKNKGSVADNQFKYQVKLKARASDGFGAGPTMSEGKSDGSAVNRIYSPAVYKVELHIDPPIVRVYMHPSPQIVDSDVKEVTIKQGVQNLTGSVVMWNRRAGCEREEAPYTFNLKSPKGNFSGVKPITIRGGIIHQKSTQFKGYVISRSYSRPKPAESYVTLDLADASRRAKDQMAVNLPIFDGQGHMSVVYYLAKECGFLDSQILFYQNPRQEDDKITLREMIESGGGDCDKRQGGDWAGHVPRFPQSIGPAARVCKLPPSTIFAVLPCNAFREQPAYMFQMGRPLWDCMNEVRNFSGWYLFPNHFGSIVYGPPEAILGINNSRNSNPSGGDFQRWTDSGGEQGEGHSLDMAYKPAGRPETEAPPRQIMEFGEVSGGKHGGAVDPIAYDQFQRNLQVTYGTDHVRNAVMAMSMVQSAEDPTNPIRYTPITVIEKQKGWPYNVNDPAYVPWPRWIIARSPYWNDLARLQSNTKQRLARSVAPRATPSFGAWGHAGLFPYDIVLLREDQANEVGVDGTQFVIQEVTKKFDGVTKLFSMDVATEYIDFNVFEWSPHDNQGAGIQHGSG